MEQPFIIGNYSVGEVLGKGGYSVVRLGTHVTSGAKFALKLLDKENIQQSASVSKQVCTDIL